VQQGRLTDISIELPLKCILTFLKYIQYSQKIKLKQLSLARKTFY